MPPTGDPGEYPFDGEFGCTQMLEVVGTGMHEVEVEDVLVLVLVLRVEVAEQVYRLNDVETDGAGPVGGYLDLQDDLEHELPGQ